MGSLLTPALRALGVPLQGPEFAAPCTTHLAFYGRPLGRRRRLGPLGVSSAFQRYLVLKAPGFGRVTFSNTAEASDLPF